MKTLLILLLAINGYSQGIPPLPPIVKHRTILRSPKAISLLPKPRLVAKKSVVPLISTTVGAPFFNSVNHHYDDFSKHELIDLYIGGLLDSHSYIIERSPDKINWTFIGGFIWGGNDPCCQYTGYPMLPAFGNKMFFRVIDEGTNQPPAPLIK